MFPRYAVLDGNACLCSNTINEKELNFDECNRPCADNTLTNCGGEYAQSIYDTEIKVAGVPKNLQIIDQKETSIVVRWSEPEQTNSLSRYIIRANIVKNYGTQVLPPSPQWTVERSDHTVQYELLNLNPGIRKCILIKYNFYISIETKIVPKIPKIVPKTTKTVLNLSKIVL